MKYLVVTGGVVSGLGKGISISSLGVLLKAAGLRVTAIKIDPYLVRIILFLFNGGRRGGGSNFTFHRVLKYINGHGKRLQKTSSILAFFFVKQSSLPYLFPLPSPPPSLNRTLMLEQCPHLNMVKSLF